MRIVRSAAAFYALQLGNYLLPIVTIVFVARLLGPRSWGSLVFMQAFAGYVMVVVTYGFNLSATREVARNRGDPDHLANLLAGVLGAKMILTAASVIGAVVLTMVIGPLRQNATLLPPAMVWGLSVAYSLSWYYQGLERMALVAAVETAARAASVILILVLVHVPADAWKVLAIQGVLLFGAVGIEMGVGYRQVGFRLPTLPLVSRSLRQGWSMFVYQGALSFYTVGNAFILGLLAAPTTVVGFYAGAEKISKAFTSLMFPATQAIFPRVSHIAFTSPREAAQLARSSIKVLVAAGCVMSLAIFAGAPVLVRIVLGPGYEPAVDVLRVLAFLPPLVAVSNVLGIQWMLALGLDWQVNRVILAACVFNVVLAVILVPHLLHVGMAVAVLGSETLVALGLYAALRTTGFDPLVLAPDTELAGS